LFYPLSSGKTEQATNNLSGLMPDDAVNVRGEGDNRCRKMTKKKRPPEGGLFLVMPLAQALPDQQL
jgi:hypothetical protein